MLVLFEVLSERKVYWVDVQDKMILAGHQIGYHLCERSRFMACCIPERSMSGGVWETMIFIITIPKPMIIKMNLR